MVIDFHVHCFPDNLAPRAVTMLGDRAGIKPAIDGTVSGLRESMAAAGIDISVIQPVATKPQQVVKINDWAAEVNRNGIIAFGALHPDFQGWEREIDRVRALGLKGIKFHPDYQCFYPDEDRMFPIYESLAASGLIVLFHAGVDVGLPPPYHGTPQRLRKVADAVPDLKMVAAHMGGFECWDEVNRYVVGCDVYIDTSYSLHQLGARAFVDLIKRHGVERVLFGTDSPWTGQKQEVEAIRSLALEEWEKRAIMGDNALRLLKHIDRGSDVTSE